MKKLLIISLILISLNSKSFAHSDGDFTSFEYGRKINNNRFNLQNDNYSMVFGFIGDYSIIVGLGIGLNYSNWKSLTYTNTKFENYQIPLFLRTSVGLPCGFLNFSPYNCKFLEPLFCYVGLDLGVNISLSTNANGNYSRSEYLYNRSGILINPAIGLRYIIDKNNGAFNVFAQIGMNNNLMLGKRDSSPHSISSLEFKTGISLPIEDWYLSIKKAKIDKKNNQNN